jgi:hypothetical protein
MRVTRLLAWLLLIDLFLSVGGLCADDAAAVHRFRYKLDAPAPRTSAGIYDAQGRLVRVLWTMQAKGAGEHTGVWDGRNDAGQPVPSPQTCEARVVINRGTYANHGVIGNTAKPANTYGHVPVNFEAIAVGPDGSVYTTHDWDEPHHNVIRWSPQTGYVTGHSGHPISALCKALAVDEKFAYVTSYANSLKERDKVRFNIARVQINAATGSTSWPAVPFSKAGPRIEVYNGNAQYPEGASEADRKVMVMPLLSLAVRGDKLYATDALAGLVRIYHKETGEALGQIAAPLAQAVALDARGRVWVGHGHANVSVFDESGKLLATPISNLAQVRALAFGPEGSLFVADRGAGQIRVYAVNDTNVTLTRTIGQKAQPGDGAPDRFYHLAGVAVDARGNCFAVHNAFFFNGGRMARFNPDGAAAWEQMGLEFSSSGNYDPAEPDVLHSQPHHTYRLDRAAAGWKYLGNSYDGTPYRNASSVSGTIRFLRRDGRQFSIFPGSVTRVYEVKPPTDATRAGVFKLVSILGGPGVLPDGTTVTETWKKTNLYLWSWRDEVGDHAPQAEEATIWSRPEDDLELWQFGPVTADAAGDLWFVSAGRGSGPKGDPAKVNAVWRVPVQWSSRGLPFYDWSTAKQAIPSEALAWPMGFKMAQHDVDSGVTYVYGHSRQEGTPQPKGVWMGGNALAAFKGQTCLWQIVLPDIVVGLDVIPGSPGGCIIGGNPWKGVLHHYTRDGLLVGMVGPDPKVMGEKPNNPSGLLDMFSAVSVNRDPRDGIIDVFVEDNFNLRIAWYRIDDRGLSEQRCSLSSPAP